MVDSLSVFFPLFNQCVGTHTERYICIQLAIHILTYLVYTSPCVFLYVHVQFLFVWYGKEKHDLERTTETNKGKQQTQRVQRKEKKTNRKTHHIEEVMPGGDLSHPHCSCLFNFFDFLVIIIYQFGLAGCTTAGVNVSTISALCGNKSSKNCGGPSLRSNEASFSISDADF